MVWTRPWSSCRSASRAGPSMICSEAAFWHRVHRNTPDSGSGVRIRCPAALDDSGTRRGSPSAGWRSPSTGGPRFRSPARSSRRNRVAASGGGVTEQFFGLVDGQQRPWLRDVRAASARSRARCASTGRRPAAVWPPGRGRNESSDQSRCRLKLVGTRRPGTSRARPRGSSSGRNAGRQPLRRLFTQPRE